MSLSSPGPPAALRRSAARERLLATASALFYAEGIASVGVDRLVKEAQVTLATFYRHFPAKQDLVVAYLRGTHERVAGRCEALAERAEGEALVRALGEEITGELGRPGFRGCAFLNAASEFEDPDSPVRRMVAEHREWYLRFVRRAFGEADHPQPGAAARHFVMLRDGAMSAAYLDTATAAARTFRRGVEGLLRSGAIAIAAEGDDP